MNVSLNKLARLSQKSFRTILGLMSGTSLDGLDIALCIIDGYGLTTKAKVVNFETMPYSPELKHDLMEVFSKGEVALQKLTLINAKLGIIHAGMINEFLFKHSIANQDIDCIASHGQTIYHSPKRLHHLHDYPDATLQIGDADHIAVKTGIPTLSDFRQKHVAAGGEGAPLALYGDFILFNSATENRILLNIGGISNFTYLPSENNQGVISTDTGPGNTLIDALCRKYFNKEFDLNGDIARKGKCIPDLLDELIALPFFQESFPKTTGPELFNLSLIEMYMQRNPLFHPAPEDLITTATILTAKSIALAIRKLVKTDRSSVYLSGGGAHNSFLTSTIAEQFPGQKIVNIDELGIEADAKEALLFALLANETICGSVLPINGGPAITMGKISLPD